MASYSVDAERFINEVKKYPKIWDLKQEGNKYKNRQSEWAGVARCFIPDFDLLSDSEKLQVYRKLHNKWRSFRDGYVRSLRRTDGKQNYKYAKELSFLNVVYSKELSQSDEDVEEELKKTPSNESETTTYSEESSGENLKRKRLNKTKNNIDFVDTTMFSDTGFEDEDRSFFDSLLPAVRECNLDQKLEFRTGVLQLLKAIRLGPPIDVKFSPIPNDT